MTSNIITHGRFDQCFLEHNCEIYLRHLFTFFPNINFFAKINNYGNFTVLHKLLAIVF